MLGLPSHRVPSGRAHRVYPPTHTPNFPLRCWLLSIPRWTSGSACRGASKAPTYLSARRGPPSFFGLAAMLEEGSLCRMKSQPIGMFFLAVSWQRQHRRGRNERSLHGLSGIHGFFLPLP